LFAATAGDRSKKELENVNFLEKNISKKEKG
jgi:hypothetical protein